MATAYNLGFPRMGANRELKKALESFWKGEITEKRLNSVAAGLRKKHWGLQKRAGIDSIPSNDFSFYDHVLDTVAMVGAVPGRYGWDGGEVGLDTYFAMARGAQKEGIDVKAQSMLKWFDTNYHYIVPEFTPEQTFTLSSTKVVDQFLEAKKQGVNTRPVLLGPVTFVQLARVKGDGVDPLGKTLTGVLKVYTEVVEKLVKAGAKWIQFDEPILAEDVDAKVLSAVRKTYKKLSSVKKKTKFLLATYFGHLDAKGYKTVTSLPVDGIALDFVRGEKNLDLVEKKGFPKKMVLAAGVVDGRNVWVNDFDQSIVTLKRLKKAVGSARLWVGPSCSLLHVPVDAAGEKQLDKEIHSWLSFAKQKLKEVRVLTDGISKGEKAVASALKKNRKVLQSRRTSPKTRNETVRDRIASLKPEDARRQTDAPKRLKLQRKELGLGLYPTTTIGSFPQTREIRKARADFRKGKISKKKYEGFLRREIEKVIRLQEKLDLDVLVHGEAERNDMVEYFGEQLDGFAFTRNGWVQSYGSRCVKPPLIYGDVSRPKPMTVNWISHAQSLTKKPVKGMLTGPVTILQWSFVRDDQPRSSTCRQIALAIRDEVADLEKEGIRIIQIDEPALREGLPLRTSEWKEYLDWSVESFRLSAACVKDKTQIQTHMCYSEFNDIIEAISDLDADVILIENSRSDLELLKVFERFQYDKEIGPGVYDIHSPRVPSVEEMTANLHQSARVLSPKLLWVNPDCGLKTRGFEETTASLEKMVEAARRMRKSSPRAAVAVT